MDYLKYVDGNSLLHKLDPRTKFMFFIVMAVVMWNVCGIQKYIFVLVKKLKVLLLFIFLLWFVLGLFEQPAVEGGPVFFQTFIGNGGMQICFDWYDFYKGFVYSLRIFLMIASFYTVLLTTNFSEIILGLQKWKISYALAFGIGLVFQIIPMIITELNAIMEAQSSRGLEIEKCSWVTKIKNYVTFSFPLLFRVISKGQAISLAMHYYQLNFSVHRTAYKNIKASKYDVYFILANAVAIAATIVLHIFFYIPV